MRESGYYPPGTEFNPDAPWNQVDNSGRELEVTVSVTLSKTFKIKVADCSECDLKKAVEEQIILPQNAYKTQLEGTEARKDLENWNVDDFEIIQE